MGVGPAVGRGVGERVGVGESVGVGENRGVVCSSPVGVASSLLKVSGRRAVRGGVWSWRRRSSCEQSYEPSSRAYDAVRSAMTSWALLILILNTPNTPIAAKPTTAVSNDNEMESSFPLHARQPSRYQS